MRDVLQDIGDALRAPDALTDRQRAILERSRAEIIRLRQIENQHLARLDIRARFDEESG